MRSSWSSGTDFCDTNEAQIIFSSQNLLVLLFLFHFYYTYELYWRTSGPTGSLMDLLYVAGFYVTRSPLGEEELEKHYSSCLIHKERIYEVFQWMALYKHLTLSRLM